MRHGAIIAALFVAALVCATSYDPANGQVPNPEVVKGIGIIEGIRDGTLKRMRSLQRGCEEQFKLVPPVGAGALLKEHARRLDILEQETNKLAEEARDESKAVLLKENSLKVKALVLLASYTSDSLIQLLKAGCFIEMRAE